MNSIMNMFINSAVNSFIDQNKGNITPTQQHYIDVLKSGNESEGIDLATNICNSMNTSKEAAVSQASKFFGFR